MTKLNHQHNWNDEINPIKILSVELYKINNYTQNPLVKRIDVCFFPSEDVYSDRINVAGLPHILQFPFVLRTLIIIID
jgi:hypothetical protein